MGRKKGEINQGAVVGILGGIVLVIGLCGTIGSFLFAAAEGRGRWTFFYGAIVWGLVQFIWGLVLAARTSKERAVDEDAEDEDEEDDRPSRRSRRGRPTQQPPSKALIGCLAAGVALLLGIVVLSVVMILLQSNEKPGEDTTKDGPPPPKKENPPAPVEPVAEDLGPKETQTPIAGATNDPTFKDQAPAGGVLIGLDVGLAQAFGVELMRAVQPRYRTPQGEVTGRKFGTDFTKTISVKAKPGYAVGAINIKAGLVVNGFSVTFMRQKGNALDPADSYSSAWIGDKTGGNPPTLLGGDGVLIVGIIGKRNSKDCNGLGLLKQP